MMSSKFIMIMETERPSDIEVDILVWVTEWPSEGE